MRVLTSAFAGEKPREKILQRGAASLSDAELLALLFGVGVGPVPGLPGTGLNALSLARRLLKRCQGVEGLRACTLEELQAWRGLGVAKATRVLAALELGRRAQHMPVARRPRFHNAAAVVNYLRPSFVGVAREELVVLLLDSQHRLRRAERVAWGSVDCLSVHPREVYRAAVRESASAVIIAHNHPRAEAQPSCEDQVLTRKLVELGQLLGVPLLDHLILGEQGDYYSFADAGCIDIPRGDR